MPLLVSRRRVGASSSAALAQRARLLNLDPRRSLRAAAPAARRPAAARAGVRATRASCARATASRCRDGASCTSTPSTSRARPTGAGGCSPTARRRRRAPATRSRTASSLSRTLPEAFRDCRVQRLAALLPRAARHAARVSRRATATNPRIVLLTPGPYNETYFEHAYLARYLGFTLVEGARPHGARPARLPEDARRPRAGRRRSCAASTTTSAIRSSCAPTRRSASPGLRAGGARRQRRGRQRARQRPGRDAGAAWPSCPSLCRAPARRGAARCRRSRRGGAASRRARATWSSISTSS